MKEIDAPYPLDDADIRFYRTNGFVRLKRVFSPETIAAYAPTITRRVIELNTLHLPMAERSTYQKAFLQIMNIWTKDELVKEFVFGRRLARLAAELMGTRGVRLYHDQALYKEAGGGITPWHADQYYWPFASTHAITAWVPLQAVPREMGPLAFAAGSHEIDLGRDLEIGDVSEAKVEEALKRHRLRVVDEPFELGDVSFHSGWTFHRAGENRTDRPREVMTVIYMDQDMRLAAPRNHYQQSDAEGWCPGVQVGELIDSPLNPVLWSRDEPRGGGAHVT